MIDKKQHNLYMQHTELEEIINLSGNAFRLELNKEREYVEKNFYTRFNIYILFISLFVTAGATIMTSNFEHKNEFLTGILLLGTIISILISISLYSTYKVLKVILEKRDQIDLVAICIRKNQPRLHSNEIIGITIPYICTIALFTGLIFSISISKFSLALQVLGIIVIGITSILIVILGICFTCCFQHD